MHVSRVVVNTLTTHSALGLSTALSPSLTLGYGSRGNNVTSDSVSPLHLMDIKRVAFETRAVEGAAPAPINAAWEIEMAARGSSSHPTYRPIYRLDGKRFRGFAPGCSARYREMLRTRVFDDPGPLSLRVSFCGYYPGYRLWNRPGGSGGGRLYRRNL